MGWDDNGLATERRVENFYGVRCDPTVPFDPGVPAAGLPAEGQARDLATELRRPLRAPDRRGRARVQGALAAARPLGGLDARVHDRGAPIARARASARSSACSRGARRTRPRRRRSGTSTSARRCPRPSSRTASTPARTTGCRFARADGAGTVEIETTRPELLPSCVALVAHPDDARYRALVGTSVLTPLFSVRVPVVAHELAEPDKGTGIAMVCTFGDTTDVVWWRELRLPLRALVGRDGRLLPATFGAPGFESDDPAGANDAYAALVGKTVKQAQATIVELLQAAGALLGEPRTIQHAVKFYEKGDRPLEIVTSRQWFVPTLRMRDRLLALGEAIDWLPPHMSHRYRAWVEGLNTDWSISRQRYFGVPFPVWYPIDDDGVVDHAHPLLPSEEALPVDPSSDVPAGFDATQRDQPGGFVGDPDVMDTWATSSLTPQIAGGWVDDQDLFDRVFPMDVRPQGPEIIRTWLFSTVVRSELEFGVLPWRHAMINGWVLDPDRKKLSKSSGHVTTPMQLLEEIGSDGVRYWAARGRPGTDTADDPKQMKVGRRLAVKVLNASKFVLGRLGDEVPGPAAATEPIDADLLAALAALVEEATTALDGFDYARALERTEEFFWRFCDDYLELVKARAYGEDGHDATRSARAALGTALSVILRLLAPFLPFATEEAWRWSHDTSIHTAAWPSVDELGPRAAGSGVLDAASEVLGVVRREKSAAKQSMKAAVDSVTVHGPAAQLAAIEAARADLLEAGVITRLELVEGDAFVQVALA